VSSSGKYYNAIQYGLNPETGLIDYDEVERLALEHKPKVVVAGFSAYSQVVDWQRFRDIADRIGALMMADIAHIAGLIATIAECILGLGLIVGYKVRWMGLGAAIITLTFAAFMIASSGIGAPFKYPVFVFTGAGLLLFNLHSFPWSVDALLKNNSHPGMM